MIGLVVFVAIVLAVGGIVAWLLLEDSMVRIEPGHLGLVLFKGKATDRVLLPGPHFVPTFRRKTVEVYPSLELSYRAGDATADVPASAYERGGPALVVALGDQTRAMVCYTVRFRLDHDQLRPVHERFGPDGIWGAVRDRSGLSVRHALSDDGIGADSFFGDARRTLETELGETVGAALAEDGLCGVMFALGDTDLGRTGEVIQATARARFELARELAEADTRQARARHDIDLENVLSGASMDAALRYREVDAWRDVAQTMIERSTALPGAVIRPSAAGARHDGDAPGVDEPSETATP